MAQKDIYKVDNYFITIGIIFLVIGSLSILLDPRTYNDLVIRDGNTYTFEDKEGRTLEQVRAEKGNDIEVNETGFPRIRSLVTLNGVILLVIGMIYRAREKKIIQVWNALELTGDAKVNDLVNSLGLEREFILRHLKNINAQQNMYYVLDTQTDRIVDGKLKAEYVITVNCKGCGNTVNQKITLDLAVIPKCSYCGTAVPVEHINKMKQDIIAGRQAEAAIVQKKGINVTILILLLFFFWPAAIIYAIKARS